jgi:hypothetical protein
MADDADQKSRHQVNRIDDELQRIAKQHDGSKYRRKVRRLR